MKRSVSITGSATLSSAAEADVSFVPPLLRRRLSPLQRIFFSLAAKVGAEDADLVVFASRDGEDTLTRRIVADYNADGAVSPSRFSASVYNAAPGLWSVYSGNHAPYTAVAAGDDTIESGLYETLAVPDGKAAVFVYAEETGGGYGAAMRIEAASDAANAEVVGGSVAGSVRPSGISFESLSRFLAGACGEMVGKWFSWRRV